MKIRIVGEYKWYFPYTLVMESYFGYRFFSYGVWNCLIIVAIQTSQYEPFYL